MRAIGIEHISLFGLSPVLAVHLAADLGCRHISATLSSYDLPYHPPASLVEDPVLRRETNAAMRDRGVSISLGEGFLLQAGTDVRRTRARGIQVMAELGVTRINTVSFDPDLARTFDQFGILAEMAAAAGMETTVEFAPGLTVADLPTALAAVRHVARPDFRLLIDTMHLCRTGAGAADVAAIDPALIGYIQLSDAPLESRYDSYMEEAMNERMVPGTGELPLVDVLAALPPDRVVALEVPRRSQIESGVGPHDRMRPCVEAARSLLARAEARRSAWTRP
ncbi:sugar phosphate isomerase/epimerase family protein [Streptomyces sp. NPDC005774]|uniref:sugar phosphate isomerase/epimerase family protein n=1 Tax=Streptomyces sp. NPDC005774 TaxID=3364728 RepID=UPI00368E1951